MPVPAFLAALAPYLVSAGAGLVGGYLGSSGSSGSLRGGGRPGTVGGRNVQNVPTGYTPQQQASLQDILNLGMGNMKNPYAGFEPIKQSALSSFQQDIVPRLQNIFSYNSQSALSSPLLKSQLSTAGGNLAERLAAAQAEFGQRQQQFGLNQAQLGLTQQYSPYLESTLGEQISQGAGPLLQGVGTALPLLAASYFGGSGGETGQSKLDPKTLATILTFMKNYRGS